MSTYKATFVEYLRSELRKREAEAAFVAKLSSEDARVFRSLLPMHWLSPEVASRLVEAGAAVLFVGHPDPVFEFGRAQAYADMRGVYRIMLKVISVSSIVQRVATLFGTYHAKGSARIDHVAGTRHGSLFVDGYPELPPTIRRAIAGFTAGLLELAGCKSVRITEHDGDPNAWRWDIAWT